MSSNGRLVISGLSCDPCQYNEASLAVCQCQQSCNSLEPSPSAEVESDCELDCESQFPNDPNAIHHCITYCREEPYTAYNNCRSNCGVLTRMRRPVEYRVRANLWYFRGATPSPNRLGQPHEMINDRLINLLAGGILNVPLDNAPAGVFSYCVATRIDITYSDGRICTFFDFNCGANG